MKSQEPGEKCPAILDTRTENLHIVSEEAILSPHSLKQLLPKSENCAKTVLQGQRTIKRILERKDSRLFAVVGPCSVHDPQSALEYAGRLRDLADELKDTLYLVMRVYFEKPRTHTGWQGFLIDPDLDHSFRLEEGLKRARRLLLDIADLGLPTAGEALDLVTPQYIQDLFSWTAIGARTTESQVHRKMASGLSNAVGFKNATTGDVEAAVNAMRAAAQPNHFISINPEGHAAVIRTKGNRHTHVVLRGGTKGPNYSPRSIARCEALMREAGFSPAILVDCSHANSGKQPTRQPDVLRSLARQISAGNRSIVGIMLESHLGGGSQELTRDPKKLRYGVSITDACLGWEDTTRVLRGFAGRVRRASICAGKGFGPAGSP